MITLKIDNLTLKTLKEKYSEYINKENSNYILFSFTYLNTNVTCYSNKKNEYYKITIDGDNEKEFISENNLENFILEKKEKIKKDSKNFLDLNPQIGSDEVGTGDFLGPIVVCAAYFDFNIAPLLKEYNIIDSKKLTDSHILETIPKILDKIHYKCELLENKQYNELIKKKYNINQIKAILHNRVLYSLSSRTKKDISIYQDQFVNENKYYKYLINEKNVQKNIIFKEKGESSYPSVALASCIARYYFLIYMQDLSKKYNLSIPLGASKNVTEFSKEFSLKFGEDELMNICKINFSNLNDIKETKLF